MNTNEELKKDLTELMAKHNGRGASRMLARYVMANLTALEHVLRGAEAGEAAETMWVIGRSEGKYSFGPVADVQGCFEVRSSAGDKIFALEDGKATPRYVANDIGGWEVTWN